MRTWSFAFLLLFGLAACHTADEPPTLCAYEGREYEAGQEFPAGDNCNTCECQESGSVSCSERDCPSDAGPPIDCYYDGRYYDPGDIFPSADGCDSCRCLSSGAVHCTQIGCISDAGVTD